MRGRPNCRPRRRACGPSGSLAVESRSWVSFSARVGQNGHVQYLTRGWQLVPRLVASAARLPKRRVWRVGDGSLLSTRPPNGPCGRGRERGMVLIRVLWKRNEGEVSKLTSEPALFLLAAGAGGKRGARALGGGKLNIATITEGVEGLDGGQ